MTLKLLIIVLLGLAGAFALLSYQNYLNTGGFDKNSAQYDGYRYFTYNNITDLSKSCEEIEKEYEESASKEWMEGCRKYLEMHR